jgi:hypothetical protein
LELFDLIYPTKAVEKIAIADENSVQNFKYVVNQIEGRVNIGRGVNKIDPLHNTTLSHHKKDCSGYMGRGVLGQIVIGTLLLF